MNVFSYLSYDAVDYFRNIGVVAYNGVPQSYSVAARVLFKDRVSTDEQFWLYEGIADRHNSIAIVNLYSKDALAEYSPPSEAFQEVTVAQILKKFGYEARAWVNKDTHQGLLAFGCRMPSYSGAALLPQLAPWKFKDNPLTDWEKKFLQALLENNKNELEKMLQEYINREQIPKKLKGVKMERFMENLLENKLKQYTTREAEILNEIRRLEEQLQERNRLYREVCDTLAGIRFNHHDEEFEDFKDAFMSNPNCHMKDINGSCLQFYLSGFLTNFNDEAYEAMTGNDRSVVFKYSSHLNLTVGELRRMYDELFVKSRYRINVYGGFSIDFGSDRANLIRGTDCNEATRHAIPHPHIVHYGCMGTFAGDFNAALRAHDYMDVLTTAQSEVNNINWTDMSPVSRFAEDLCYNYQDHDCIWDRKAKEFITPNQLARRIKNGEQ